MKTKIIFFINLLIATQAFGQYELEWARTYGANTWDEANSVLQLRDTGYVMVGTQLNVHERSKVIRFDKDGNIYWERELGDVNLIVVGEDIIQLPDESFMVAGYSYTRGAKFDSEFRLVKLASNGDTLWSKTYGGDGDDKAKSLVMTRDGNIIVVGSTRSNTDYEQNIWILKIDQRGNLLWQKQMGDSKEEMANSVTATYDGGCALVGYKQTDGKVTQSVWLIKLDANGRMMWENTYHKSTFDYGSSVIETRDSCLVYTGYTKSIGLVNHDVIVAKTDKYGGEQWCRIVREPWLSPLGCNDSATYRKDQIGYLTWDEGTSVIETYDSSIAVSGFSKAYNDAYSDFRLILLSQHGGTVLQDTSFIRNTLDYPNCLIETNDKGLLMVGCTYQEGRRGWDFAMLKYPNREAAL